ncbi:MAG: hypothetical protein IKE69_08070 [Thermoguttaceae bacterium]|nr:hypothetical protein [Thermoguttaceae bacterium]
MGIKELCDKYNRPHPNQAINAAIRAELPAGNEVMDLLALVGRENFRKPAKYQTIYDGLLTVRQRLADEIARRYNLKSADTESKETDHEEA